MDPGNYATYLWQDNSTGSNYTILEEGTFWVEVTDEYGCVGSDTVSVKEICPTRIYVPNAFSPNFDGTNDRFGIYGFHIKSMKLTIFDRWGGVLFETVDPEERWDGTVNGEPAATGVYLWQLQVEGFEADGDIFSEVQAGTVTLLR